MKMRDGRMRSPLLEEMLAATLGLALAGNLILCIVLPAQKWRWILSIAASAAAAGVSYLIGWLGYRRLASALYIGLLIIGFTGLAATAGGTHSPAMLSFPVLVMTSGMLLGDGAALVAGVACSLAGLGLALAETGGILPASRVAHTPFSLWALNSTWTFVLVALQRVGNHIMRRSLRKAESELAERQKVERQRKKAEDERTALEAQFRQAQKMEAVGQLAGGVAHDFNNLLMVINGYAETLLDTLPPGDSSRPMIEQMVRAAEHASSLTRQLLTFSRKRVVESLVVDINQAIANLEKMLLQLLKAETRLELRLEPAMGRVETDPALLEQALINLVLNARDAMPSGGQVTIETQTVDIGTAEHPAPPDAPPGHYALVKVRDTGLGMDERVREHLFEPFFTTKPAGQGTGLGLTMVYGFVKQSGGHIRVESRVGEGSAFLLYLPVIAEDSGPGRGNVLDS